MQNHSLLWAEGVLDKGVGDHLDIEGGLLNMGVSKGIDTLVEGQAEVLVDNLQLMNAFEILLVEVKLVEIETEILMMAQSLLQMQNFGLVQNYLFGLGRGA